MTLDERRKRLLDWMHELLNEATELATDHETFWRVREIVNANIQLRTMSSPYWDLFQNSYAYSTAMCLRRLTERSQGVVSLANVLSELKKYPSLAAPVRIDKLSSDLEVLERVGIAVRKYADPFVAHHDKRSRRIDIPTFGDLKKWVASVLEIFHRYYAQICGSDVDLVIDYLDDFKIFTIPWILPP